MSWLLESMSMSVCVYQSQLHFDALGRKGRAGKAQSGQGSSTAYIQTVSAQQTSGGLCSGCVTKLPFF